MPYEFRFKVGDDTIFREELSCFQCTEINERNGQQCRRRVCIGLPFCYHHIKLHNLQIKNSTIPNAGKGLFAFAPILERGKRTRRRRERPRMQTRATRARTVIFNEGNVICNYYGEFINEHELQERYRIHTAPFGVRIIPHQYEDGALFRGMGSLLNHQPEHLANAAFRRVNQTEQEERHIELVATKPIRNGDEIFVDYEDEYILNEPNVEYTTIRVRRRRN
jgi:hypothetical protein